MNREFIKLIIFVFALIYFFYWYAKYEEYLKKTCPSYKRKTFRGSWRLTKLYEIIDIFHIPFPKDKKFRYYSRNLQFAMILLILSFILLAML